jgi:uncharacterized lipoprotein YmbA
MKTPTRANFPARSWLLISGLWLLIAGCSLPSAMPDPTRFYLLSTSTAAPAAPAAQAPVIHLRPVELPSYIRAKPLIVRRGDNEVEFREYARWGEPLELGIGRVVKEELLARGAAAAVLAGGLRAVDVDYNYELIIRVLACEGVAGGAVNFRAAWELSTTGAAPKIAAQGEYRSTDLKWDGKNEGTLAAQLSVATTGLAADIAAGLAKAGK